MALEHVDIDHTVAWIQSSMTMADVEHYRELALNGAEPGSPAVRQIAAIKALREHYRIGLKEAKDVIEYLIWAPPGAIATLPLSEEPGDGIATDSQAWDWILNNLAGVDIERIRHNEYAYLMTCYALSEESARRVYRLLLARKIHVQATRTNQAIVIALDTDDPHSLINYGKALEALKNAGVIYAVRHGKDA